MARLKGDGARLPLKKIHRYVVRDTENAWREVETAAGIKLTSESRERIHLATTVYANIGPIYSPKRSVLAKDAKLAIDSWLAATERLIEALTPPGADLGDFMPPIDEKLFSRMSKLTSIGQVALVGLIAVGVSQKALDSLGQEKRNGRIEQDQWVAWVCLVTKELRAAGLKIAGKSLDKSNSESPYIRVMLILQSWLPGECRHCGSYESMRTRAQAALMKFGRLRETTLFQIIAGWGTQLLPSYPGNLRQASEETLASFDNFAQRVLDQAKSRVSKARAPG